VEVTKEYEDGLSESLKSNLLWDVDDDIATPLFSVYEIANRKWYVSFQVGFVLLEDHVPPGAIEVSGRHDRKASAQLIAGVGYIDAPCPKEEYLWLTSILLLPRL
jgi:hypothetical protein